MMNDMKHNLFATLALAALMTLTSCDGNGSRQTAETLLEEAGDLLTDSILTFDALTWQFNKINI